MAACTFGTSIVKISNLNLGFVRTRLGTLQAVHGSRSGKPVRYQGLDRLVISKRFGNALIGRRCSSETDPAQYVEHGSEEVKSSTSQLIPNSYEVESLLNQICDTTSIAEFELKLGGFRLYVTRDLTGRSEPVAPQISAPVSVNETVQASDLNGLASTPSLAISKPLASSSGVETLLDKAADEGLVILKSPMVGYFRRSRTIKGKRSPPSCKEKQIVKEGQVLCYIEQLGGEIPIESDIAGEVVKILRKDGDPVGYGDPLIAILPSFPGINLLQ